MAKARAFLVLELEAYEASSLLAFLDSHADEFSDPDRAGGDALEAIANVIEQVIPEMSYTPPVPEEAEDGEDRP